MKTQEDIIKELNDELDSIFNKYMLLMQAEIDKAKDIISAGLDKDIFVIGDVKHDRKQK